MVVAKKEVTEVSGGDRMFIFSIEHSCGAIDRSHLSLFFQGDTPIEKCMETLDKSEGAYTHAWNNRPREDRLATALIGLLDAWKALQRTRGNDPALDLCVQAAEESLYGNSALKEET